jgi:hypothetical protein
MWWLKAINISVKSVDIFVYHPKIYNPTELRGHFVQINGKQTLLLSFGLAGNMA